MKKKRLGMPPHTHIIIRYPPYLDKMTKETSSPTKKFNFVIQKELVKKIPKSFQFSIQKKS